MIQPSNRIFIVIPARKGSTRFPNKPMASIHGKSVLFRTWCLAKAVRSVAEIYIATDDEGICKHAQEFGAQTLMTRPECRNGTERVFDALQQCLSPPDAVINLQADAVLTPPWVIQTIVDTLLEDKNIEVATPATPLTWKTYESFLASKKEGRVSGTLVVFDLKKNALYFSKGLIPFLRSTEAFRQGSISPVYRHIGLYGYRYATIKKYVQLAPTPLEEIEGLEQLRLLENGIPIRVALVDYQGRTHGSIDNPDDLIEVEEIIRREGELLDLFSRG